MHRNGMRAITFVIATLLAGMTHGVEAQALRVMTAATLAAPPLNVRHGRTLSAGPLPSWPFMRRQT